MNITYNALWKRQIQTYSFKKTGATEDVTLLEFEKLGGCVYSDSEKEIDNEISFEEMNTKINKLFTRIQNSHTRIRKEVFCTEARST